VIILLCWQKKENIMELTIHRGTNEVGGSCVEINSNTTRILIDMGLPLDPVGSSAGKTMPVQAGGKGLPPSLNFRHTKIDAVLISHPHQDHFGLLPMLPTDVPIYMSKGCETLIGIATYFNQVGQVLNRIEKIKSWEKISIGDICITPYLADHSAIDAFSFLIESEQKRIFYTGDLRAHGRKKILFDTLLLHPPENIDYLILEGTMLGRPGEHCMEEAELEEELVRLFTGGQELFLVNCSSQNIDRLVSLFRACVRSGRKLVIDPYTAYILAEIHKVHDTVPNWDWNNVRVFFTPNSHTHLLAKDKTLYKFIPAKITIEEIQNERQRLVFKMNRMNRDILKNKRMLPGAQLIWSVWNEYYNTEDAFWKAQNITPIFLHTSGHAHSEDLQRLVKALKPGAIIPIHTFNKMQYPSLFPKYNICMLEDGVGITI